MAKLNSAERVSRAESLYERYYEDVFGYLHRLAGERVRAGDLAQEALLAAAREPRAAKDQWERAWLFRAATDLALGRPAAGPTLPWAPRDRAGAAQDPAPDLLAFGRPGPLEQALAALTPEERAPLLLRTRYRLTVAEVSYVLRCGEDEARRRLAAARDHLDTFYRQASDS